MTWKTAMRFIFRAVLVVLSVAALLGVTAFMPGPVEGTYNNFLWACMCDGRHALNVREGRVTMYHDYHMPVQLFGRYVTRKDGVVEFYRPSFKEPGKEELVMTAYPYLLVTKFVSREDGLVSWQCKVPAIGKIGAMIRDQEIVEDLPAPKGQQRRRIYSPDFKLIRHEAKRGKEPWRKVAGDEMEIGIFEASQKMPHFGIHSRDDSQSGVAGITSRDYRRSGVAFFDVAPQSTDGKLVTPRREYRHGAMMLESEVSRAAFENAYQDALPHDTYLESFHREHVDLMLVVPDGSYIVEYESGELNGEVAGDERFRIAKVNNSGQVVDPAFGTSHDRTILNLLRRAVSGRR